MVNGGWGGGGGGKMFTCFVVTAPAPWHMITISMRP